MSSASGIRAGKGFVELGVDAGPLEKGLHAAQAKFAAWGKGIMAIGAGIFAAGAGLAAGLTTGLTVFATYEQSLADLRAATGATGAVFDSIRAKIEQVSLATGTDLNATTAVFSELIKAGRTVEEVVGGMGDAVIRFARVSGMDAAGAAAVLTGALNIFRAEGLSAVQAMNIINQAADSSRASLAQVAESFTSGGAAAATFNQSMRDTATAIAIMANAQVQGGDAGTSLRRIFVNLGTGGGNDEGGRVVAGLQSIGLTLASFRDEAGRMLPMVQIINRLNTAMSGLGEQARQAAITDIGGMYGMTGLTALLNAGTTGWSTMQTTMEGSLTIEQKFSIMTDTLVGSFKQLWVYIQRVAVALGEAMAPALRTLRDVAMPVLSLVEYLVRQGKDVVVAFDTASAVLMIAGVAMVAFGVATYGAGFALAVIWPALSLAGGGLGLVTVASWALTASLAVGSAVLGVFTGGTTLLTGALSVLAIAIGAVAIAAGGFVAVGALIVGAAVALASFDMQFADLHDSLSFLDDAADWFAELWNSVAESDIVIGLIDAFDSLWDITTSVLDSIASGFESVWQFLGDSGVLDFAADILKVGLAVAGISVAVISLIGYAAYLAAEWAVTTDFWMDAWTAVVEFFSSEGESVVGLFFQRIGGMIAETFGAIRALFKHVMSPFIELGEKIMAIGPMAMEAAGLIFEYLSGAASRIASAFTVAWGRIAESATRAWGNITASFSRATDSLTETATQAWGGILGAFNVGDWESLWAILEITALIGWEHISVFAVEQWEIISAFASETFITVGDLLKDTFTDAWTVLRQTFAIGWGFVRAGWFDLAASIIESLDPVKDTIRVILRGIALMPNMGVTANAAIVAMDLLTTSPADMRVRAAQATADAARESHGIQADAAADSWALRDARAARDAAALAVRQGLGEVAGDAAGQPTESQTRLVELQARLDALLEYQAEQAFYASIYEGPVVPGGPGGPGGPGTPGGGPALGGAGAGLMGGSYFADALRGSFGGGGSPAERSANSLAELVRQNQDLIREIRRIQPLGFA